MSNAMSYRAVPGAMPRDRAHTLFAQTMGYVALTAGLFALGAYLGRDLSYKLGWVWFIAAFVCLVAMNFAARKSNSLTVALLLAFGLLLGLAIAPTLAYYASVDPPARWQGGGASARFVAGVGAGGDRGVGVCGLQERRAGGPVAV